MEVLQTDPTLPLLWSVLCALSVTPLGYMLGSSCSPCCGPQGCGVADGKPRTDPATEGHWVPSGTWATGVTWTFSSSPSTTDGGTWYFYGSSSTSKVGGGATTADIIDFGNICNWYSNKTTTPSSTSSLTTVLDKRATRLPPEDAIVHIYGDAATLTTGYATFKNVYFWAGSLRNSSEVTTTDAAFDSSGGCVFNGTSQNRFGSIVNGGATFTGSSANTDSGSTVNGGATFYGSARNSATVNGGATFNGSSSNFSGTVNGGATLNDNSSSSGTVNGGATFNDSSEHNGFGVVNGGATFNDFSLNTTFATVNDGATFNDSACSDRVVGSTACGGADPRTFVAHPTDLPTCNGTAPIGCANFGVTCGCG